MHLMWFRSDLRAVDNLALCDAMSHGPCKALFLLTDRQWQEHHWSDIKIAFVQQHLEALSQELAVLGIELDVIEAHDFYGQIDVLTRYCEQHKITRVYANSEPEINEINRDNKLIAQGTPLSLYESDVIVPKGQVLTGSGEMYKVFTPFKMAWLRVAKRQSYVPYSTPQAVAERRINHYKAPAISKALADKLHKWPSAWQIRSQGLIGFFKQQHPQYHAKRDFPAINGTSRLSPYLAIGAISGKEVVNQLLYHVPMVLEDAKSESFAWLNELVWRDFYRHLIFHFPKLCKSNNFQIKYDGLNWRNDPDEFKAWCDGKTGYPIVDAAMRQLVQTGWMHNRLRMIVASFLTKHLLIDWRWGEKFFMQHLIDGDLAANNGGWQWAASTGCDAQPYFRIFNPIAQSEKFDPDGDFIRMYVPELKDIPAKHIHFPHEYLALSQQQNNYWPAIVDHKTARLRALETYKAC
ncbi:MAG: deoxyribodipyrimidine photo-lyase [Psychrobium sp.]